MLESQNLNSVNEMSSDPDITDMNNGLKMVMTVDGNTRFEKNQTVPFSELGSTTG